MPTFDNLHELEIARAMRSDGFMRLSDIIAPAGPLPISRSTWFSWQKTGKAPLPVKLSPGIRAYRAHDIHALITKLSDGDA